MSAAASTAPPRARAGDRRVIALPELAFAALLLLSVVLVIAEMRGYSFYGDEWDYLVDRRGVSAKTLLMPHGPHLTLVPIVVYKAMLQIFGMSSYAPYKGLAAFSLVLLALAVGIFGRSRWGPWWGLIPVVLLVTLGPAAETFLLPFQFGLITATVAGVIALISADRGGRRGDGLACLALCVSLASGSQGVGALVGAAIIIALAPGWRRRVWVIAVPAVLYGIWYLHYGQQYGETHIDKWATALPYAMQALSSTLSSLTGLATLDYNPNPYSNPAYGQPLALALLAGTGIALWRGWRPPRLFWGAVATLIVLWVAAALSNNGGNRLPETPRYLPVTAAFLFVAAIAALPRPRVGVRAGVLACAALAVCAATNAGEYAADSEPYRVTAEPSRAALGALLIARGIVEPSYNPGKGAPTQLDNVTAGPYFSAVDAFGTNAYTPAELSRTQESNREFADSVLIHAERIGLVPITPLAQGSGAPPRLLSGNAAVRGNCLLIPGGAPPTVIMPAIGVRIDAPSSHGVNVVIARFGTFAAGGQLGEVPAGSAAALQLPSDHAPRVPWRVAINGAGARVCSLSSGTARA